MSLKPIRRWPAHLPQNAPLPLALGRGPLACSTPVSVRGSAGWLHTPNPAGSAPGRDVAVLMCPGLGWDGLHAHQGFRLMADAFASVGYPALRFHYPGTGDSADMPEADTAGQWAGWVDAAQANAAWLLAATDARRLVLLGLRFGAVVATAVAERRRDAAGLVLLAPVLRGRSYMRQLDMEARLEAGGLAAPADPGAGLHLHGIHLTAGLVRQVTELDLGRANLPPGLDIAIFPQAASRVTDACIQAWRASRRVHHGSFAGLEPLLQEAIHTDPPAPAFTTVLDWANAAFPSTRPASRVPPQSPPTPAPIDGSGCSEVPLRFGVDASLFGVLCRPAAAPGRLAVLILNTGRDPHVGIARFAVELSRRLAAQGVASLRMDFAGLGDSRAPRGYGDQLTPLFDMDRTADIAAAMDSLSLLGFDRFALQGLCSGAYHALRASQRDDRVGALMLVNLPAFDWQGGRSVRGAIWASAPASRILDKLGDRGMWRRALAGQAKVGPFARAQAGRLWSGARRWLPLAPALSYSERAMATLASRGARALFLYSPGDPGLDVLEAAFGQDGGRLQGQPGVTLQVVPGMDHILSGRAMRATAINLMLRFLADLGTRSTTDDYPIDDSGPDDDCREVAEPISRTAA